MKRLCVLLSSLALFGCGDTTVKEVFGIDNRAPDEFRVVSRPPLSVPPEFDLQPPGTGQSPTVVESRAKAESLMLGKDGASGKGSASSADQQFLKKAGIDEADPTIKQQLMDKKIEDQTKREDEGWWDKITTLPGSKEPVVKADEEAERLKKNKETGKPANEGNVPETGNGPVSVLQRWLGND